MYTNNKTGGSEARKSAAEGDTHLEENEQKRAAEIAVVIEIATNPKP